MTLYYFKISILHSIFVLSKDHNTDVYYTTEHRDIIGSNSVFVAALLPNKQNISCRWYRSVL